MKDKVLLCSSVRSVLSMAAPRSLVVDSGMRLVMDEEKNGEDSPTTKKPIGAKLEGKFPLTRWEFAVAVAVFLVFSTGLFCIYLTMPAADYGKIKLPRTIADLRLLKWVMRFRVCLFF